MQLILREEVKNLGKKGDIVNVAPGYGRNYLLPKKLAMEVNDNNLRQMQREKKLMVAKAAEEKQGAENLAARLSSVKLSFRRKVHGEELYGSVSQADLAAALEAKGFSVEKRKLSLEEPIKTLGEFSIPVRLHPEVVASVSVAVEKEED
ncbi:MAG: 50S ribosomal protein L9 [Acidobacteriota bacterium]